MLPRFAVSALRTVGQGLDVLGTKFQVNPHIETLQKSVRVVKLGQEIPKINNSFVTSSGTVVGKVSMGPNSFVGFGTVIRGDGVNITIGENVTIGDRVMVHVNGAHHKGIPTVIGNNVTIGAGAIVHGATLEDFSYVGEGSQVMDGAIVRKNAAVGPGSVLTSGKIVPEGQLWSGMPAKFERALTEAEILKFATIVEENLKINELLALETAKTWETIEQELNIWRILTSLSKDIRFLDVFSTHLSLEEVNLTPILANIGCKKTVQRLRTAYVEGNLSVEWRGLWRRTTKASYKEANPEWETVLDIDQLCKDEGESWVYKADGGFILPPAKSSVSWKSIDVLLIGTDLHDGVSMTDSGYPPSFTCLFAPTTQSSLETYAVTKDYILLETLDTVKSKFVFWRFGASGWKLAGQETDAVIRGSSLSAVDSDESNEYWLTDSSFLKASEEEDWVAKNRKHLKKHGVLGKNNAGA
eukprot:gene29930-37063_t